MIYKHESLSSSRTLGARDFTNKDFGLLSFPVRKPPWPGNFRTFESLKPPKLAMRLSAGEREVHGDGRIHLDRLAVQNVGTILPLLDRVESRLVQQRRSAPLHVQILNGAILVDNRIQNHRA